jgi:hypothetical protein
MKHGKISLVYAAVFVATFALVGGAQAAEPASEGEQQEESAEWAPWSREGLFFGPAFGVGDATDTDFAWEINTQFRPWKFFGFQFGYFRIEGQDGNGDFDGVYLNGMPIIPIAAGVSAFAEGGWANFDGDDAWTAGGGLLYDIKFGELSRGAESVLRDRLTLRAGYRYMDFDDDSANMGTVGILYRLGKIGTP